MMSGLDTLNSWSPILVATDPFYGGRGFGTAVVNAFCCQVPSYLHPRINRGTDLVFPCRLRVRDLMWSFRLRTM